MAGFYNCLKGKNECTILPDGSSPVSQSPEMEDETTEDLSGKKKSKFQSLKKLFAKKKKKEPLTPIGDNILKPCHSSTDVSIPGTLDVGLESEPGSKGNMGNKALSHDSVFITESLAAEDISGQGSSQENIPSNVKALQLQLQQNIRLVSPALGIVNKRSDDTGAMSEDDGLPRSPPEISTLHDVIMGSSGMAKSPVQRNSSLSLGGTDSEEEQLSSETPSRPTSVVPSLTTVTSTPPLYNLVPVDFSTPASSDSCLDSSAAKHKISVKPNKQRTAAKRNLHFSEKPEAVNEQHVLLDKQEEKKDQVVLKEEEEDAKDQSLPSEIDKAATDSNETKEAELESEPPIVTAKSTFDDGDECQPTESDQYSTDKTAVVSQESTESTTTDGQNITCSSLDEATRQSYTPQEEAAPISDPASAEEPQVSDLMEDTPCLVGIPQYEQHIPRSPSCQDLAFLSKEAAPNTDTQISENSELLPATSELVELPAYNSTVPSVTNEFLYDSNEDINAKKEDTATSSDACEVSESCNVVGIVSDKIPDSAFESDLKMKEPIGKSVVTVVLESNSVLQGGPQEELAQVATDLPTSSLQSFSEDSNGSSVKQCSVAAVDQTDNEPISFLTQFEATSPESCSSHNTDSSFQGQLQISNEEGSSSQEEMLSSLSDKEESSRCIKEKVEHDEKSSAKPVRFTIAPAWQRSLPGGANIKEELIAGGAASSSIKPELFEAVTKDNESTETDISGVLKTKAGLIEDRSKEKAVTESLDRELLTEDPQHAENVFGVKLRRTSSLLKYHESETELPRNINLPSQTGIVSSATEPSQDGAKPVQATVNSSKSSSVSRPEEQEKNEPHTSSTKQQPPKVSDRIPDKTVKVPSPEPEWVSMAKQKQKDFQGHQLFKKQRSEERRLSKMETQQQEMSILKENIQRRNFASTSVTREMEHKSTTGSAAAATTNRHCYQEMTQTSTTNEQEGKRSTRINSLPHDPVEPSWLSLAKKKSKAWSDRPQIVQ
ncbi:acrosomal protein KIAA1210-like isoform X2 [Protopterus annectens]|uniref:acrosomal protein KIAA1210-like isoform X2 n=1 Tax=Protopterus annectens TaxID=7888 RepID=UPI001CFA30DC|nr:acrosomal protein KIAA1210-like isoform X2 [Protopterus annectens]